MGAKTDLFPTFPELCATARDVEKKPLSIPPRPIDGKLVLDENFGIFPREFEDYTYSFLLFEAQKIERRLSADAIASTQQESMLGARRLTPEQQMENDLHKFVSSQEQSSLDEEEGKLLQSLDEKRAPLPPQPSEVSDYERKSPEPRAADEDVPAPEGEEAPVPPAPQQARPRMLPPKMGAPQIPFAKPAVQMAPKIPAAGPSVKTIAPKPPAAKQPEQDAFEPYGQPAPPPTGEPEASAGAEAAEKRPPAGISSYSKLSPRLQSLIEAKLRREEEKVKKAREDSDIFKTPPPEPPEEESETGEQERQKDLDAPNAWNVHDEEEEGKGKPSPPPAVKKRGEETLSEAPFEDGESLPEPDAKSQRKLPLRKMGGDAAPLPEDEQPAGEESLAQEEETPAQEGAAQEKELAIMPVLRKEKKAAPKEAPAAEYEKESIMPAQEEKEEIPIARSRERAGPITIKPMFPDAASQVPSQEKQEISQSEDSDRMRRIQRIIEELSPDRMRAQPRQDDVSFEREGKAEPEEAEPELQAAQAPQKTVPAQKPKLKKSAKKAAAAPVKKLQKMVPAEAEEEAEEIPIARKAAQGEGEGAVRAKIKARIPQVREEENEEAEEAPPAKSSSSASAGGEQWRKSATQAPRKLAPRVPAREEEEEQEEQAPPRPLRKLVPRLPVRESEGEEERPPAPRKLAPRLPVREEEGEEGEEQEEAPAAPVSPLRRRILPGMGRTIPSAPQTYVPPARERKQIALPSEEEGQRAEEAAGQEAQEEPEEEQAEISPRVAPLKPRKIASDEAPPEDSEKTPEQIQQEQKMAKMAEQLAKLEAGKTKEVAGTAALPSEEEDIPLPDEGEGVPKPEEYEQAKESLRKALEHEETARKVKQEDEALIEQYAKDHLVWLYEIYKMGGMGREDFLQKASEKYSEAQSAGAAPAAGDGKGAPANPALAALGKEIEKKDKK